MIASDYPITTGFGQQPNYPLNGGFHNGVDRAMPNGTPVIVNGVTIGLSNNTGASTGSHLHIGKFVNGVVQNPNGGGFTFNSAVVFDTGHDLLNGNFVRITGDGALWNYLHLATIMVTKGQVLKGEPMFNEGDAVNFNNYIYGKDNGRFRDQIGLDWKTASYNIQEQLKKDNQLLVNAGDVPNLMNAGITNATQAIGKDWKDAVYSVILPNVVKPTGTKLTKGTYVVD